MRPQPSVGAAAGPVARAAVAKRRWTRVLLVVGLVTLGMALSLVAGALRLRDGAAAPAEAAAARDAAVSAAVSRMSAAAAAHDEAAFVSVADPGDARLRARLAASFRGLSRLPATSVGYRWTPGDWVRPPGLAERYADAGAAVAIVRRVYHLSGWDRAPATELLGLTFARRDGRWVLVGDGDGAGTRAADEPPEPWAARDVSVVTRPHVLVVGDATTDPAATARLGHLADRMEGAVRDVARLWQPAGWNGRAVVYAVTDPEFVRARFRDLRAEGERSGGGRSGEAPAGSGPDPGGAEFSGQVTSVRAAAYGGGDLPWVAGSRLVLAPAALGYTDAQLLALARHELTHLATFRATCRAPAWIVEGAAEYTEHVRYPVTAPGTVDGAAMLAGRGLPPATLAAIRRGTYRPVLVAGDAFYDGTAQEVAVHYDDAWLVALYVADVHGESVLRRLLEYAGAPGVDTPAQREAAALRDVLGMTPAELADGAAGYAASLVPTP